MRYILFLSLVITINSTKASNYYFSSVLGDDNRTPMQAKNPSTPWKTLDKLNTFFSSLKPGDSALLKRGDTFYGSVTISRSGTANLPIVIGAYGSGNNPVISGFVPLTWTSAGNNIYESQALTPARINVLTISGALQAMGRYPNTGYLNFESHSGTGSITDNDLAGSPNWTGAELVLRIRRFVIDKDVITSHSGNTISFTPSSKYEPKDKFGYFIQNSLLTLDKQGEWYYNPSTKKVSLYSTSTPANVSVSTIDNLVVIPSVNYVVLNNLTIAGANKNAVSINSGSNADIESCDLLYSGEDGVKVTNHTGFKIQNSTIENSMNTAIDLGTSSDNAVLRNNIIQNTSVAPGMCLSGDQKGIGIFTKSSNVDIEYNKITSTGFIPIYFGGDQVTVKNNFIDSFCYVKDDGGGIYTYIGTGTPRVGRKIIGNIVMNGFGAPEGTDNPRQQQAAGIYLDDNTCNVEVRDNTVSNCNNQGIFIQNTSSVIVTNNTFFDNHVGLGMSQRPNKLTRNNIITQNVFFSKVPSETVSSFTSGAADIDLFGKFDSNYYVKPLDNNLIIYNSHLNPANNGTTSAETQGWKQKYGRDENTKNIAPPSNPNYSIKFEYNPTNTSKAFSLDGNYVDAKNNKYTNKIVLDPYASAILIKQR